MDSNSSEDGELFDEIEGSCSDGEILPNFPFHNLKADPDLQYQFNHDDADGINEFLDEAITSNLEKLDFKWKSECLICSEYFEEYQDLLQHCKRLHKNEFDEYACTLQDCDAVISNAKLLARHLVLRHSDLESIKIYTSCPYCGFRCSNFNQFNKHSCYRKLPRKACMQPYCQYCNEEFGSHKRFLFHLQFHLVKRRPKICLICNAEFIDVDEFFMHVHYSHEPPERFPCTSCDRVFMEMETYNTHQNMHKLKPRYKCDQCNKKYHNKRCLMKHKEDLHTNVEYKCDLCPKIFPTFAMLQTHMKWHNPDAEVHVYTCTNCGLIERDHESLEAHISNSSTDCFECLIEEGILIVAFSCIFCAQDFKDKNSLRNHRASGIHEDGQLYCPICNEAFENQKSKRLHLGTHRNYKKWLESLPLKRLYMCDEGDCEECYTELKALNRHKHRIHKTNTCQKCNKKLANADELQNHIQQCQSIEFICQFCDKICPTKMSLAIHVSRSHNNKNILCPHCSSAYKDQQALQKHIDMAHVPVPCAQCDKVVSNRRYLAVHIRAIHESECRYFCSYCNKGFYHRSQKDLHEENIHPDSLYKCGECNFETKYADSLKIHVSQHLRKWELKCPYCSKTFGRKNALNMHIKRHENDKPFRCCDTIVGGCDAAYITRHLLNNHIKSKHPMQLHKLQGNSVTSTKNKIIVPKQKLKRNITALTPIKTAASATTVKYNNEAQELNNVVNVVKDVKSEETNFGAASMMNEEVFIDGVGAQNTDENYMLLVVAENSMQMVNNGQLFMFESADMVTS